MVIAGPLVSRCRPTMVNGDGEQLPAAAVSDVTMWGKIIGSFAGFAMGGPIGALFGAAAGHAYDRMYEEAANAQLPPWSERRGRMEGEAAAHEARRQMAFTVGAVVLGAKIAKVDGPVNRAEINAFKGVFRVPPEEVRNVGRIFDVAKQDATGYEPYARQIAILFRREPAVLEDLLASLFYIAQADGGIKPSEIALLRHVADLFGLDARAYERVRSMFLRPEAADPYGVLGLTRAATDEEVKRTYRRLIREHHPDALIAKGLPKNFIEVASRKMAAINAAYDQIERERRLR
jgi:DnaJ like chaperone protein